MEIDAKNIKAAYRTATESGRTLLCALFPDLHLGEERIKTFEDACLELGEEHPFVRTWNSMHQGREKDLDECKDIADILAYHKLRVITAAMNDGWEPKFTQDEERWYPWFDFLTDEEVGKGARWKREHAFQNFMHYRGEWAGFAFASSSYVLPTTAAGIGSRLCYKSEALADYSGHQFAGLWADFYLIKK